jgi:arylsulfatase A-like enzyme
LVLAPPVTAAQHPDVVVILVDTLRVDRLGCYGSSRGLTPAIDALAARGVVFLNAHAASSWTKPSVASLFTSRLPLDHGARRADSVLAEDERTLAEAFHDAGYATGAVAANPVLDPRFGFGQGFDGYDVATLSWKASEVRKRAGLWLAQLWARHGPRPPIFLYVHYMEPHTPYAQTRKLSELFGPDAPSLPDVNRRLLTAAVSPLTVVEREHMERVYDAEVAEVDAQIGSLQNLFKLYRLVDPIFVVVADHGEEFWDHGGILHGHTLYEELIHVPLVVVASGVTTGGDVTDTVSLLDVAPSLLDLAGIPRPASFRGRSLRALLMPRSAWGHAWDAITHPFAEPSTAVSEVQTYRESTSLYALRSHQLRAMVRGRDKAIWTDDGPAEFYDLADDPRERRPAALGTGARRRLEDALASMEHEPATPPATVPLDPATRDRLRALGYAVE